MNSIDERDAGAPAEARKAYAKPALQEYGAIGGVTEGGLPQLFPFTEDNDYYTS